MAATAAFVVEIIFGWLVKLVSMLLLLRLNGFTTELMSVQEPLLLPLLMVWLLVWLLLLPCRCEQ